MINNKTQNAPDLTRIIDLAEAICEEMGYSGKGDRANSVDYAFQCVNVQNEILQSGIARDVRLFHPDRPLPFIDGEFNKGQVTGDLRLDADGVRKMRAKWLSKPTSAAECPEVQAESAPDWQIVPPKKYQNYGEALHKFLIDAHAAGKPLPRPSDVYDAWRRKAVEPVTEADEGLVYYQNHKGVVVPISDTAEKTIDALRASISRMTTRSRPIGR
ncbi:MAG: hypothetical protein H6930_06125 [Rhodoferax sp.]|nr:hypothetical protein [Rhodoferax sp.]